VRPNSAVQLTRTAATFPVSYTSARAVRAAERGTVRRPGEVKRESMKRLVQFSRLLIASACPVFVLGCATNTAAPLPEGMRAPSVVSRVEAEYPAELRAAGVQGQVVISGTVPKEGGVLRNPRVVRSDDSRLEPFALEAVSRWTWRPGLQDGQPVDVEFTTTVTFSLNR
jgi:TonB family protein